MSDSLNDEIDELAIEVETTIQEAKEINEEFENVFDSSYRQMEADAEALFSA